jgi:hypothetical protein
VLVFLFLVNHSLIFQLQLLAACSPDFHFSEDLLSTPTSFLSRFLTMTPLRLAHLREFLNYLTPILISVFLSEGHRNLFVTFYDSRSVLARLTKTRFLFLVVQLLYFDHFQLEYLYLFIFLL